MRMGGRFIWLGVAVAATAQLVALPPAQAGPSYVTAFRTSGTYALHEPEALTTDNLGNVYVADTSAHRIVEFDKTGAGVREFGDGSSTTSGQKGHLYYPSAIVFANDQLYVVDASSTVNVFSTSGVSVGHWGVPGGGPGQLNVPLGIAADCNGNIYIANSRNNHVDEFDKNGNAIRAFGIGKLAVPTGIAFDEDSGGGGCGISTIYVSDEYNNDVVVFDGSYQYMKTIGGPGTGPMQFGGPEEIAFDDQLGGNQTLWVSESGNNRVQELTTENGGATWTSAAMVTHGDEGSIVQPHGTTLTPTGDLLIDDSAGHLFEYADKAAALTLKAYHMSRQHLRTSSQLSYVLDYNQVDGSCLVTVTAKLVARNYAFTLTKKVKGLTDTGDLVDLRLTQRQLTHVEDGWKNGGPDLRIHTVADGSCTGGKQLTATSSSKF